MENVVKFVTEIKTTHFHNTIPLVDKFDVGIHTREIRFVNGSSIKIFSAHSPHSLRGEKCNQVLYEHGVEQDPIIYRTMLTMKVPYLYTNYKDRMCNIETISTEDSDKTNQPDDELDKFLESFKIVPVNHCAATQKSV